MAGRVIHIDSMASWVKALKDAGDKAVVVDFFATWCPPCQLIAPCFEALAKQHGNLVFLKVDVDKAHDVSSKAGVACMPAFQFYCISKMVDSLDGANKEALAALCAKHGAAAPAPAPVSKPKAPKGAPAKPKKGSAAAAPALDEEASRLAGLALALLEKARAAPLAPKAANKKPAAAKRSGGVAKRAARRTGAAAPAAVVAGGRTGGALMRA